MRRIDCFIVFLAVVGLCWVLPVSAAELLEDFDDGSVDANEIELTIAPGGEINFVGGRVELIKSEGVGNGFSRLTHRMTTHGDFVVTVLADRTQSGGGYALGLVASHLAPVAGFTDIFYSETDGLSSLFLVDAMNQPTAITLAESTVTLRIRRVGGEVFHEYDTGTGFQTLASVSDAALTGPVTIGFFLGQQRGYTALQSGALDDIHIIADRISPSCGNGVLSDPESCDDGHEDWQTGEYCASDCEIVNCGDPDDSGAKTATDALFVLRTSVGLEACDDCICDVNRSGGATPVTASDALLVLQGSVGQPVSLNCIAC